MWAPCRPGTGKRVFAVLCKKSVAATAADKHKVVAWEADVAKSAAGVKVGGVYDVSVVDQPTSKIY
jgi:hypothetical protein